ncbi:MAG: alpha/beta hydrolase [Candidatus Melainabacteria bacterium]|nr:alpha/beta hydrolase [Candidatus Melainabacteria bacterium]
MQNQVQISIDHVNLEGILGLPEATNTIIVFAHGSGSSRLSERNQFVAHELYKAGFGYLLFDLLTTSEDLDYENRFNIPLLANRLQLVTEWVKSSYKNIKNIGYFGASTGAAAAIVASSELEKEIVAVVSRGGRPDLAKDSLKSIKSPILLIVGGNDFDVYELNKHAYELVHSEKKLTIVKGATHLFEEPGTLEEVAKLAVDWFKKHSNVPQIIS